VISFIVTIILASLSYNWIEKPSIKLGEKAAGKITNRKTKKKEINTAKEGALLAKSRKVYSKEIT
jgi:peptidoglycan/LPS O-acetylase OafA/YrhL